MSLQDAVRNRPWRARKSFIVNDFRQFVLRFWRDEAGPTAVEYAVLLAVISATAISAFSLFGDHVNNIFTIISSTLSVFT